MSIISSNQEANVAGESILVVEPDSTLSKTISEKVLRPCGFKPLVAQNQADCAKIVLTESPHLLLLHLPPDSSVNLLHDLARVAHHPPPAILITDQESSQIPIELLRLGVRDCLTHPFTITEVLQAIHRVLGQEKTETDQERLSLVIAAINNVAWLVDTDLKVVMQNEAASEMIGWSPTEAMGQSICDLLISTNCPPDKLCQLLRQAITAQQPIFEEALLTTKENRSILVQAVITPIMHNNQAAGALCILQHQGGRNNKHIRLEFANMASHLLRHPLSFIQTSINLLMNSDFSPVEQGAMLDRMWEQSLWLTRFTDELLEMLRLETGEVHIYIEPVALLPLIKQVLNLVQYKEALHHFKIVAPDNVPMVSADSTKVEVILFNLLTNAVDRCPNGGHITVELEGDTSEVTISIIDDGEPISKKLLERVFGQFYPVDDDNGKMPSTYQLGLYTTKRLVELQNGRIWATSQPKQGSRFGFSLPIWGRER